MDVLSDALSVVRLTGAVFFTARFGSPWKIVSPPAPDLARFLGLESDCLAVFHIVAEGECWLSLLELEGVHLNTGDVVILPRAASHIMGTPHNIAPQPLSALLGELPVEEGIPLISQGGVGPEARFVCGYLHCDQRFNPLIGALPEILVLRAEATGESAAAPPGSDGEAAILPVQAEDWLAATLRHTVKEAEGQSPGNAAMLARLTEILFVEALRRYMWRLPMERLGWLAAVRDPVVGHALRQLHAHPECAWTVDELARSGAVSRSTLAQRFVELVGEPPMRYLTAWRMQLAQYLLRQSNRSLAEVALRVGYESEAAFNRAFKRHTGQPPATWRASRAS